MKKIINKIKSYLLRLWFADELKTCRDMIEVASRSGTYDVSPYFHGVANGMIYLYSIWTAMYLNAPDSIWTERDPMYLDAPDKWLDEKYNHLDTALISDQAKISHHENTIALLRERINQLESEEEERRKDRKKEIYVCEETIKAQKGEIVFLNREKNQLRMSIKQLKSELATAKERVKGCERVCHECHFKKWEWVTDLDGHHGLYHESKLVGLVFKNLNDGTYRGRVYQTEGQFTRITKHFETLDSAQYEVLKRAKVQEEKSSEPTTIKNGWIRSEEDPTVTQVRSRLFVDGECKAGIFGTFMPGQYFCYTGTHALKNESGNIKYWTSLETAEREVAEIVNEKEVEKREGWIDGPPGVTCIRSRYYVKGRETAQIILQGLNEFTALLLHYRNENQAFMPRKIEKVVREDGKVKIWRRLTDAQNEVAEIVNGKADGYYWKDSPPNPDRSAGLASELFNPDNKLVAVIRYDSQGYYGVEDLDGYAGSIIRYSSNKKPIEWETLEAAKKAVEKRVRDREAKKIVVTPKEELKKYWWEDQPCCRTNMDESILYYGDEGNHDMYATIYRIIETGKWEGRLWIRKKEVKDCYFEKIPGDWNTKEAAKAGVLETVKPRENKSILTHWHWYDYTGPDGEKSGSLWKDNGVTVVEIKRVPYKSRYTYIAFWQPEGKPIKYSGEVCRWPVNDLAGAKEWIETEYRVRNSK